jgi:transcriptional regulator with XRE-family HTH domain
MPHKSRLKLPPLDLGHETVGQRIRRLRTALGLTQVQLALKMGLLQNLISDYERNRLRLHAELVVRFALALEVSTDELLGIKRASRTPASTAPSVALSRRMVAIDRLPLPQRKVLLRTIDAFIRGVGLAA